MISITFQFDSITDLQQFLKDYNQVINKKQKPKREDDKRGYKTKEFHQRVKQFQSENPDLSYLECLKHCKKTDVN